MLEVLFHGCQRNEDAQSDIEKRVAALSRFDAAASYKVTVDKVARMAPSEYCVKVDIRSGSKKSLFVSASHPEMMQAINLVFDSVKRKIKDENEKSHQH